MPRLLALIASAVLFTSSAAFSITAALLKPAGVVEVNGAVVTVPLRVKDGDRIKTTAHASAYLMMPGEMITIGPASAVVYRDKSVVPENGPAKITTVACSKKTPCTAPQPQPAATNKTGVLYTHGTVTVNGTAVPTSTAVFSGDKIQTAPDSAGVIISSGAVIPLAAATDYVFGSSNAHAPAAASVASGGAKPLSSADALSLVVNSSPKKCLSPELKPPCKCKDHQCD
jgi:ribosomal 50S subunit-recycling heat shock protein